MPKRKALSAKQTTLIGSEVRLMESKCTGRTYRISIALPYAYFNSPNQSSPLVYLIDANWYFGMLTEIVRIMPWDGITTDAIIVGIGYIQAKNPQEAMSDSEAWRSGDLTPVRVEEIEQSESKSLKRKVETGGADKF